MKPKRKIPVSIVLVAIGCFVLPWLFTRWRSRTEKPKTPYVFPFQELAALDRVVQARFAVVPTDDFGMARVGDRHGVFVPMTPDEKTVVAALKRRRREVVFYVAGRNYLTDKRAYIMEPQFLQGPVFITGKPLARQPNPYTYFDPVSIRKVINLPLGLPDGGDVWKSPLKAPARQALEKFETSEGTEFQMKEWTVVARPVRATQQACVDCHNAKQPRRRVLGWSLKIQEPFRLGDTIGVAMYAYRPSK